MDDVYKKGRKEGHLPGWIWEGKDKKSQCWKTLGLLKNAIIITYYSKQLQRRALKRHFVEKYLTLIEKPTGTAGEFAFSAQELSRVVKTHASSKNSYIFNVWNDSHRNMNICISY